MGPCRNLAIVWICLLTAAWRVSPAATPEPKAPAGTSRPIPTLANTSVSIPWQELQKLLDAARGPGEDRPPVGYAFSAAEYTATASGRSVKVVGRCDVEVLSEHWALVPLGPAAGGLRKVTADGKVCPVVMEGNGLYALLSGKGGRKLQIDLELPLTAKEGVESFQTPLIPSPIVTVTTTIPRVGLAVRAGDDAAVALTEAKGKTTAVSNHRGGVATTVSWRMRPAKPRELPTRIYAETETLVSLDGALARSTSNVRLQIVHTPVSKLKLLVDAEAVVLSVAGEGVIGWAPVKGKAAQALDVTFDPAAAGDRTVTVVTERDLPEAGGPLRFPALRIEGAKRDRGTIAFASANGWRIEPAAGDAGRIGVSELPESLRKAAGTAVELAYQYRQAPATVSLAVARAERLPAKLYANTATLCTVEAARLRCRALVQYDILHGGVDGFRLIMPAGAELLSVSGPTVRRSEVVTEAGKPTLVVDLKDIARGDYQLTVTYETRLAPDDKAPVVPLLLHPSAAEDRGSVGVEVRGGLEIKALAKGAERVDVKELSGTLWASARSPLLMGFQYARPPAEVALDITRHKDIDVLVAMSDVCEATTTITPEGKGITKMMYVLRNNRKQFMTLDLPDGAEIWSAFVNDRPVTPVRTAEGKMLIPLVKSEPEDEDDLDDPDNQSYRARRDRRRSQPAGGEAARAATQRHRQLEKLRDLDDAPADLKPYDVEIVFVIPKVKLEDRGELKLALPGCDIPTGHLAWAVCMPRQLRVLDAEGNLQEVSSFTLPFRHFAEAELARRLQRDQLLAKADAVEALKEQQMALEEAAKLAIEAKAQGVLPVRVEIPVTGEISRFEKLLVVKETPEVTLTYRKKID